MKQATIFNGKSFVQIHEGELVKLFHTWYDVGITLEFHPATTIKVKAIVDHKESDGIVIRIESITADNELDKIQIEAIDVEFESKAWTAEPNFVEATETYIFNQKDSKKNIVAQIEELGLNINTNQTKAKILEELKELSNVEII